jgi:hypothetical protein
MATVDLGKIRFNWKGAYAGGTAYVANDVVSFGGASYICILASTGNATSNGTYWSVMSSAGTNGTNGTDLGTVITTEGDIAYRDGSGLQRLAKGTASQVLTMNGGATAPSWDDAGGGTILQMKVKQDGTRRNITTVATGSGWVHTTGYDWAELSNTITLASTSSRIWVVGSLGVRAYSSYSAHYWVTYNHSGITETAIQGDDALYHGCTGKFETTDSTSDGGPNQAVSVLIAPATTNEITIKIRLSCTSASYPIGMHQTVSGSTNDTDGGNWMSNLTVMEIGNITPTLTETEIDTA